MKTYKLTKEEYDELQELLFWWRVKKLKKQKKTNKRIKEKKGLNPIIDINTLPFFDIYDD